MFVCLQDCEKNALQYAPKLVVAAHTSCERDQWPIDLGVLPQLPSLLQEVLAGLWIDWTIYYCQDESKLASAAHVFSACGHGLTTLDVLMRPRDSSYAMQPVNENSVMQKLWATSPDSAGAGA